MPDLITFAQAQAYGGAAITSAVAPLISQISRTILSNLQRPSLLPATYADVRNGNDGQSAMLSAFPVLSVSSVVIDGLAISAGTVNAAGVYPGSGWVLEALPALPPGRAQSVWLRDYRFNRGIQNCTISYSAGYQVSGEAWSVPVISPHQIVALQPFGAWGSDCGVTYATGVALTAVTGAPAVGQYVVSGGIYTFSAADAGAPVLIAYGYVPLDVAYATAMWVAEAVAYTAHIGQQSKTLGGQETVSYIVSPIPKQVDSALQPYRRVVML